MRLHALRRLHRLTQPSHCDNVRSVCPIVFFFFSSYRPNFCRISEVIGWFRHSGCHVAQLDPLRRVSRGVWQWPTPNDGSVEALLSWVSPKAESDQAMRRGQYL
jgi:hypothetical protein